MNILDLFRCLVIISVIQSTLELEPSNDQSFQTTDLYGTSKGSILVYDVNVALQWPNTFPHSVCVLRKGSGPGVYIYVIVLVGQYETGAPQIKELNWPRLWPSQSSCRNRNSLHVNSASCRFLTWALPSETPRPSALLQRSNASKSNTLKKQITRVQASCLVWLNSIVLHWFS